MKDWYRQAFEAAKAEARQSHANEHGEAQPLDRILRDKLFPDSAAERAHLHWREAHFHDREPVDLEPGGSEPDHDIER